MSLMTNRRNDSIPLQLCSWNVTIGFHDTWNHPELIIIGRSRATAHHILDTIATGLDNDRRLDLDGPAETLIPGTLCFLLDSDNVGFARWYYRRRQFPPYQIVWPNHDGLYPWSPSATKEFREWQPALGAAPSET